jgi:hypothetical protein
MAPIHVASALGDLARVKRLVEEEGVNPEEPYPSNTNSTPLQFAVVYEKINVMTYLLETCGVDVDQINNMGWTALHLASHKQHVSCIRLLLQHGANPNIPEARCGITPLMTAAYHGSLALLTLLLEDGRCNLETKGSNPPRTGDTAILLAAQTKNGTASSFFCPIMPLPSPGGTMAVVFTTLPYAIKPLPKPSGSLKRPSLNALGSCIVPGASTKHDTALPQMDLLSSVDVPITTYLCPAWSFPQFNLLQVFPLPAVLFFS